MAAAKSPPVGCTALLTTSAYAVHITLPNPGYDAERDPFPVVLVASRPNMIVVPPAVYAARLNPLAN